MRESLRGCVCWGRRGRGVMEAGVASHTPDCFLRMGVRGTPTSCVGGRAGLTFPRTSAPPERYRRHNFLSSVSEDPTAVIYCFY